MLIYRALYADNAISIKGVLIMGSMMKKGAFSIVLLGTIFIGSIFPQVMESRSKVDWTKATFTSDISLNIQQAGIPMPSGKSAAIDRINSQLPLLIKDPLLSVQVDCANTIGDLVLQGSFSLEELTKIIDAGERTPGVFKDASDVLFTNHTISLNTIAANLIKHRAPLAPSVPIEDISSRAWTGIIIDARGVMGVHGEYVKSSVTPCFFPKVWDEAMTLVYEKNMVDPASAKERGIAVYDWVNDDSHYKDRIGIRPLRIKAMEVFGANRTDLVISHEDALRILTVDENRKLLEQGKVVILLEKDELIHPVSSARKTKKYYYDYKRLLDFLYTNHVPNTSAVDTPNGIRLALSDLKFYPDSNVLLPEESGRLSNIIKILKEVTRDGAYTVLVEGHAADLNKPEGQMQLSIQRAKGVIEALVKGGLLRSMFSYKGYGATQPIADNSTTEGRALNRRVEITILPTPSEVQELW